MKYTDTLLLTQCKLRMAFKQILADLTQETANYGFFFGYSLEMLKKSTFPNFLGGILLVCYKGYLSRTNPR